MVSKLKLFICTNISGPNRAVTCGHPASVAGYKDGDFNQELCPDPVSCARNCHLEGNSQARKAAFSGPGGVHISG